MSPENLEKVEEYAKLKEEENLMDADLKKLKERRKALGAEIAAIAEAEGQPKISLQNGGTVSVIHMTYAKVEDEYTFVRWLEESGLKDTFTYQTIRNRSNKNTGAVGIDSFIGEAKALVQKRGGNIEDYLPPGLTATSSASLRVNKPQGYSNGFSKVGQNLVERLKNE